MAIFETNDPAFEAVYAEEAAMVDASELVAGALERSGLSRTELAEVLGVAKSEVTARLAGSRNITIRNLAKTLHVLGAKLELHAVYDSRSTVRPRKDITHINAYVRRKDDHEHDFRPDEKLVRKVVAR